jgi:hypothetical protein
MTAPHATRAMDNDYQLKIDSWIKQAPGVRQLKAKGRTMLGVVVRLHVVANNLIRATNLPRAR